MQDEQDQLAKLAASNDVRITALEAIVKALGAVLLNRLEAQDREDVVAKLYAGARSAPPTGSDARTEMLHRLAGAYMITLVDQLRGDEQSPEDVVRRQRPS